MEIKHHTGKRAWVLVTDRGKILAEFPYILVHDELPSANDIFKNDALKMANKFLEFLKKQEL